MDLALGPDVHSLRRLVEHQHQRRRRQPARDRDLLLIAAGERRDRHQRRRRSDAQRRDVARRRSAFSPEIDQAAPRDASEAGHGTVRGHRHLQHHAVPATILRYVGNAGRDRLSGVAHRQRAARDADLPRIGRRDAENGLRQLCAAGADQAGQAENFAAAHCQRHVRRFPHHDSTGPGSPGRRPAGAAPPAPADRAAHFRPCGRRGRRPTPAAHPQCSRFGRRAAP